MKDKNNIAIEYYHADIEMWLERQITAIFFGMFFYTIALVFLYMFFNSYPGKLKTVIEFLAIGIISNFLPDFTIRMHEVNDSVLNLYNAGVDKGLWTITISYGLKMIYTIPVFFIGYFIGEKYFNKKEREKEETNNE